jgi:hypothetical protein
MMSVRMRECAPFSSSRSFFATSWPMKPAAPVIRIRMIFVRRSDWCEVRSLFCQRYAIRDNYAESHSYTARACHRSGISTDCADSERRHCARETFSSRCPISVAVRCLEVVVMSAAVADVGGSSLPARHRSFRRTHFSAISIGRSASEATSAAN